MDVTLRAVRNILNKLTVNNILPLSKELGGLVVSDKESVTAALEICIKYQLSSEVKLLDFQLLCLSGLTMIHYKNDKARLKSHIYNCKSVNHTNLFRYLGFIYLINALSVDETLNIVLNLLEDGSFGVEPLINFFQLCALQMRATSPVLFVESSDSIFGKVIIDEGSSRGRFFLELIDEIKSNNNRILKKYVSSDLETVLKQLQTIGRLSERESSISSSSKRIKGINTPSRVQIFSILTNSSGIEDAIPKLLPLSSAELFNFDIWFVSYACMSHESVYNPFYAAVCAEISKLKYKVRKSLKLFLKSLSRDIDSLTFKGLYLAGRFIAGVYSRCSNIPMSYLACFCSSPSPKSDTFIISCIIDSRCDLFNYDPQSEDPQLDTFFKYCRKLHAKVQNGYLSQIPGIETFSSHIHFN